MCVCVCVCTCEIIHNVSTYKLTCPVHDGSNTDEIGEPSVNSLQLHAHLEGGAGRRREAGSWSLVVDLHTNKQAALNQYSDLAIAVDPKH